MQIGHVKHIDIEQEMRASYLDYAMSVIVARALPDVRDGLKPVHRRILFAMYDMGLWPDKPYKKSARIVGEVLGKYHPHGDSAVYDAMVRMAQAFSLRYPLVDGQGNFGSVDDDAAAAMRYTEARLQSLALEVLRDIEEETVDFGPNFDGSLAEPLVLPSALPNLLVNGATGIAVGMSTNVPAHNLGEVVDALVYMLEQGSKMGDVPLDALLQFIHGPDFPTGGLVYRYRKGSDGKQEDVLQKMYATGRGHFTIQARAHFETNARGREQIIVTELPYQTNKTRLIERIASLVRGGKIEGVADLRDESDRNGMRVVVELGRNADRKEVLALLYKYTAMRQTFGAQFLALVQGEPRLLSLRQILRLFIEHRIEIVTRRTTFRLKKARHREHILAGLLIALEFLDEVIRIIRHSRTTSSARNNLIKRFRLSEIQAQAILDMQLKRLSALERKKVEEEHIAVLKTIAELEALLDSPAKLRSVIKEELLSIKSLYDDNRRTIVADLAEGNGSLTVNALLPADDLLIWIDRENRVRRLNLSERRKGTVPGRGHKDAPVVMTYGNSQQNLLVIMTNGQAGLLPVHLIPEGEGASLTDLLAFIAPVHPVAILPVTERMTSILLVSKSGRVKRVSKEDLRVAIHNLPPVIRLDKEDQLVAALSVSDEKENVLLVTRAGKAIRFNLAEVRLMGLAAAGVLGLKLAQDDFVVGAVLDREPFLWLVTDHGYAKRMGCSNFTLQKRYGAGIVATVVTRRSGYVASVVGVDKGSEIFSVSQKGGVTYLRETQVPKVGRTARGSQVVKGADVDPVMQLLAWSLPSKSEQSDRSRRPVARYKSTSKADMPAETASNKPARQPAPGQVPVKKRASTAKKPAARKKPPRSME